MKVNILIAFVIGFFINHLLGTVCQSRLVEGTNLSPAENCANQFKAYDPNSRKCVTCAPNEALGKDYTCKRYSQLYKAIPDPNVNGGWAASINPGKSCTEYDKGIQYGNSGNDCGNTGHCMRLATDTDTTDCSCFPIDSNTVYSGFYRETGTDGLRKPPEKWVACDR